MGNPKITKIMIDEDKPILKARVLGYLMTGYKHGKDNTKYNIEVSQGETKWNVKRSFMEIVDLHKKLKKICKTLPKRPRRKIFKVVKAEKLEERKEALNVYIQKLVAVGDIQGNLHFVQFFDLQSKHSPTALNEVNLVGYLNLKKYPYTDFKLCEQHDLLFGVCADINEGFLTKNLALRSKEEVPGEQGAVVAWKRQEGAENKIDSYEFLWVFKPKSKATCIDYCPELSLLAIGTESGDVICLKLSEEKPSVYREEFNLKVHDKKTSTGKLKKRSRVVGIWVDEKMDRLYSVAEDKQFKMVALDSRMIISSKDPEFILKKFC